MNVINYDNVNATVLYYIQFYTISLCAHISIAPLIIIAPHFGT